MSNALAIAAVTATLRNLIIEALNGPTVTLRTPDKAVGDLDTEGLNLFLYHVVPSNAWRNQAMQGSARPGETANPSLGLNLYYVLSACGDGDDELVSQRLLGLAMSALHDHPLLTPSEILAAVGGTEQEPSGLEQQVERVRITLQPLSIEDMYKLWSAFQTSYRVSAAYEVSVVLVESTRPTKAPLPVLRIGPPQTISGVSIGGPVVGGDLSSFPLITSVDPPHDQMNALLGDKLSISGTYLAGSHVDVELRHRLWPTPEKLTATTATDTEVTLDLPPNPALWPPGLYTVAVLVTRNSTTQRTNELVFSLAPQISSHLVLPPDPPDPRSLQLVFTPEVWPGQRVSVLLGGQEIRVASDTPQTGTLTVPVDDVAPGSYYVRLRVDGIDSSLVDPIADPPAFNAALEVILS